jgi:hypothetical protein
LYVFTLQDIHKPFEFGPVYPTLQRHADLVSSPVDNVTEFEGHAKHGKSPIADLYEFFKHA